MKKLSTLFIILFCLQISYAQSDFRKGYVITNKGDTISGLIDYREGRKNYEICDFKKTIDRETISYLPDQIKAYRFINDKFFESRYIKNENAEKVFLEVLVRGRVSLFKYFGRYFVGKDTSVNELKDEPKEVVVDGRIVLKNTNEYRGILFYILRDCVGLRDEIANTGISEKALTRLIAKYNKCIGAPSTTYQARKPWFKASTGVAMAFVTSSIQFTSGTGGAEHLSNFDRGYFLSAGVNFELNSPRLNERVAFIAGLYYLRAKYISFNVHQSNVYTNRNDVSIELKQLKIPWGFRYNFPERKITPYINLGVSNTLHLNTSSSWIWERERNSVVDTYEKEALEINKNQLGYWGGAGIRKKINDRFIGSLEIRYELTNGITTKYVRVTSEIENIHLLISLRF